VPVQIRYAPQKTGEGIKEKVMKKVSLQLRPYDALAILSFCREYVNDSSKGISELTAIHEAVNAYEQELYKSTTMNQLEDAILESKINYLTNRHPPKTPNQ
jgi:hypothetical protein